MGKKYYSGFGTAKNNKANMPQGTVQTTYSKKNYAIMEGGYTDTQQELDRDYNKQLSKVKCGMKY